jgi:hypothetical protein
MERDSPTTLDRISAIESREPAILDWWIEPASRRRGSYRIITKDARGKKLALRVSISPGVVGWHELERLYSARGAV